MTDYIPTSVKSEDLYESPSGSAIQYRVISTVIFHRVLSSSNYEIFGSEKRLIGICVLRKRKKNSIHDKIQLTECKLLPVSMILFFIFIFILFFSC